MFRRLFNPESRPAADPYDGSLAHAEALLKQPSPEARSALVLARLASELDGDVRGLTVTGSDRVGFRFEAVHGYSPALLHVDAVNGPWRDPGPRLVANLVAELFTPNTPELRSALGQQGLREARAALVVPVSGASRTHGALLLLRHPAPNSRADAATAFSERELQLSARWGSLLGEVQAQAWELHRAKLSLVEFSRAFVEAVEASDFAQLGHARRVTAYALAMGRALQLEPPELADLYFAAMLHDIGKLGNGLDLAVEDEAHPQRGANLVASSELLAAAAAGIRSHHEHFDGSGFPAGLRRDAIPLLGRLVAVADHFDVLSSERGEALPLREVEQRLEARSGRELDPALVTLFVNILRQGRSTQELGQLDTTALPF